MKNQGGFQKLEAITGDDNQSESCFSMTSSQQNFDFTATLVCQSLPRLAKETTTESAKT